MTIAAYAAIGDALTFTLQPVAVHSPASHAQRIVNLPLLGQEWHIPASFDSTLLTLIRVGFLPADKHARNLEKIKAGQP